MSLEHIVYSQFIPALHDSHFQLLESFPAGTIWQGSKCGGSGPVVHSGMAGST